jgi:hypothetical protein
MVDKEYTPHLDQMSNLIMKYQTDMQKMTDVEIMELRAELSIIRYRCIEEEFPIFGTYKTSSKLAFTRTEGEIYKKCLRQVIQEGYSKSQAKEMAGKYLKCDPDYLSAMEDMETWKDAYWQMDGLIDAAKDILNTMSKRKPHE